MLWIILITIFCAGWVWGTRRIAWYSIDMIHDGDWSDVDGLDYGLNLFLAVFLGWAWPLVILAPVARLYRMKPHMFVSPPRSHRIKMKEQTKKKELKEREKRIAARERECDRLDELVSKLERM